jgi:flagellar basal-body rod protein FlgG
MLPALDASAAGMAAQEQQLNAISNNIANLSTNGYRAQQVAFSDLLYNQIDAAGTETADGAGAAADVMGESSASGGVRQTGQPLDVAIAGEGFFELKRADGQTVLTRDGHFELDDRRRLVSADGAYVNPPITLPQGVSPDEVHISTDGTLTAGTKTLGKLAVVNVAAPDKLLLSGANEFTITSASGPATKVKVARVAQGALEGSDVNMAAEMATMTTTQRSYQLGSSAIQLEDQMMSIANQMVSSSS